MNILGKVLRLRALAVVVPLLAIIIISLLLLWPAPTPPTVQVLSRPYSLPLLLRDRIAACIPRGSKWTWAYRVLDVVFGKRAVISLSTQVLQLRDLNRHGTAYGLSQPDFMDTNGLQVWLLPGPSIKSLRQALEQIGTKTVSQARIITFEGAAASLFSGEPVVSNAITNQVGFEASYFARIHPGRTDLFATVQLTTCFTNSVNGLLPHAPEVLIQTNLDLALRTQIHKGTGVFLIHAQPAHPNDTVLGVLIDPP